MERALAISILAASMALAAPAMGAIKTETVLYKDGDTVLEGYLAYDDALTGKRPGVLVFHEWWGINDYIQGRARQLAEMGYVAFAGDIYGQGWRAKTAEEAGKLAGEFRKDNKLLRSRARLALDQLKANKLADGTKLAAIGYCFGGTTALELARSGADLRAVVSFHGGLTTADPADAKNIKASILVLTGGDDPGVPPEQVAAFEKEMRDAKVDWQAISYGGAVHAFTNPAAGNDPAKGAAYNERAARRSWEAMQAFFAETIGPPRRAGVPATIGRFARDRIAKPVAAAGNATAGAMKQAFIWTREKLSGQE